MGSGSKARPVSDPPEAKCGETFRIEKDFSQLDPREQADIRKQIGDVRSAVKRVDAALGSVKARLPGYDYLIRKNEVIDSLKELDSVVKQASAMAAGLP